MGTVGKALDLLDLFTHQQPQMGLSQIARAAGLNKATCHRLLTEMESRGLVGAPLSERLSAGDGEALRTALERMEDTTDQQLDLALAEAGRWRARLSQWPQGDGLIVCELSARPVDEVVTEVDTEVVAEAVDASADMSCDAPVEQDDAPVEVSPPEAASAQGMSTQDMSTQDMSTQDMSTQDTRLREDFRRSLVELMLSALEVWERATGTGRLELAEKSRIWRVAVDDGRVRARAMERYLGVSRLPQNPRWRDVVRTGYYVLEHCAMDSEARERLQRQVDAVLAYTRRSALV